MIKEDIKKAILTNLKDGKITKVKVLRFLLSEIYYAEIEKRRELIDTEIILLLQKEVKKRKEAIEMFRKGKRNDLVTDEEQQITIIEGYLPKQLSEGELSQIIDEVISTQGENPHIGKIIGFVMVKVKGRADGNRVASLVKQKTKTTLPTNS